MGADRVGDHRGVAMHRSALLGRRPGSGRFYGGEQTRVTYDYHYLGLGWGHGQGDEGSQHEDPLAAPI